MILRIKEKIAEVRAIRVQGLAEFALVIPILLSMIFGIFEMGSAIWVYTAVANASREAARYGSSVSENDEGTPYYLDCAGIRATAKRVGAIGNVGDDQISISYDRGPETASLGTCPIAEADIVLGDRIVVNITGSFIPAPAIPLFDFPTLTVNSITRRTILKQVLLPYITPPFTPAP